MIVRYVDIENTPAGCRVEIRTPEQHAAKISARRAKAAKRAKRRNVLDQIFGGLALLSFLLAVGGAGGVECETLTIGQGMAYSLAELVCMTVFTYLGRGFYGQHSGGR